jgi:hypothetical protein
MSISTEVHFRIDAMPYDLTVNGRHQSVDADPSTPLL